MHDWEGDGSSEVGTGRQPRQRVVKPLTLGPGAGSGGDSWKHTALSDPLEGEGPAPSFQQLPRRLIEAAPVGWKGSGISSLQKNGCHHLFCTLGFPRKESPWGSPL